MVHDMIIGTLFERVLEKDIERYGINKADIRTAIQNMKEVYKPNPSSLSSQILDVANYNDVAHRCAYLHKYAAFHTALVSEMFQRAMKQEQVKRKFINIFSDSNQLTVCSLGGGPGTDILGVIFVLVSELGYFQMSATIIDCMENWNHTFSSVVEELGCKVYGELSDFIQPQYFKWNYIGHNLLGKMSNDVNKAIQGAHLITMVKFISAAACKDTSEMIKKIFRSLKPGAIVLYIDNAGGGFHQIMQRCAHECKLYTLFGPLKHEHYTNGNFNVKRFGYTPCLETKVSFHMWQKSSYAISSNINSYSNNTITPRIHQPPASSRSYNNTVNQYNIINTNLFYANTSNYAVPANQPIVVPNYVPNHRGSSSRNTSSRHQHLHQVQMQQPRLQPQTVVSPTFERYPISNENSCCPCCVIS